MKNTTSMIRQSLVLSFALLFAVSCNEGERIDAARNIDNGIQDINPSAGALEDPATPDAVAMEDLDAMGFGPLIGESVESEPSYELDAASTAEIPPLQPAEAVAEEVQNPAQDVTQPKLAVDYYSRFTFHEAEERQAVCNDGTPATFYFHKGDPSSNIWIVYLEGGGGCNTEEECLDRIKTHPERMTSNDTLEYKKFGGILSTDKKNPFVKVNKIFVPYCTSDIWQGDVGAEESPMPGVSFRGFRIVKTLFEDLKSGTYSELPKFTAGSQVVLVGSSAGGGGALTLTPYVAKNLPEGIRLKTVIDSCCAPENTFAHIEVYKAYRAEAEPSQKYIEFPSRDSQVHDYMIYKGMNPADPSIVATTTLTSGREVIFGYGVSAKFRARTNYYMDADCSAEIALSGGKLQDCNSDEKLRARITTPLFFHQGLRDYHMLAKFGVNKVNDPKVADAVRQFGHDIILNSYNWTQGEHDGFFLQNHFFHVGLMRDDFTFRKVKGTTPAEVLWKWVNDAGEKFQIIENLDYYRQ